MALYSIQGETLSEIADAIREKTETEEPIQTNEMSSMIRSIEGSSPNAVLYTEQSLTDEQKAQARENIGAAAIGEGGGSSENAVLYTEQDLTSQQKNQARKNIDIHVGEEPVDADEGAVWIDPDSVGLILGNAIMAEDVNEGDVEIFGSFISEDTVIAKDENSDGNISLQAFTKGEEPSAKYATKEELAALTAEDVGARPVDWTPTAEDVGAVSIHGGTVTGPFNVSGNMSINNGDFNMNGRKVWNLPTPTGWGDAANKGYVDDGLSTKAANIGKGAYTGDVNIVGDNGVPANSALWVSQAANLPNGHQWGVLETWQPQSGAILQRFSSSDGGVFWREYFHNGVSADWHIGWQRLDNKECAPTGFGLGEINGMQIAETENINNYVRNGVYFWGAPPINAPTSYCAMRVFSGCGVYFIQEVITGQPNHDNVIMRRFTADGINGWSEWEYENPPMINGVEYRTTERYEGKPVYTKLFTTGAMTNGTWMVYAPDATLPIRCFVTDAGGPVLLPRYAGGALQGGMYTFWYDVEGNQFCAYHGSAYGAVQYNVQIWYVK